MLRTRSVLLLALLSGLGFALPHRARDIPVTRWVNDGTRPGTFTVWQQANPPTSESRIFRQTTRGNRLDPGFDIIVNATLYDSIQPALDTLVADISAEGLSVSVVTALISQPESLRRFLQNEYSGGMTGALLIGNLPVAWFQMIDDWNGNGMRDPGEGYEEFPCDLFYMDLNGTWQDSMRRLSGQDSLVPGHDAMYDRHDGDLAPEIWLGRITARPCGDEKALVNDYLRKVHAYRQGELNLNDRALVFVDDDWAPWADEFNSNMGLLYPSRVLIADPETTRASRYRQCLSEDYEWVGVYSHSNSHLHAMKYHSGDSSDCFYEAEIPQVAPLVHFYNLFACSNARYTDTGYMAGRYIYSSAFGLNSIGSTKTGSMLDFGYFYGPLGAGQNMGQAFASWLGTELASGYDPVGRSWFYGMCLNGDPTLRPRIPFHDVGIAAIVAPTGTIDSGTSTTPVCRVTNYGLNDETFDVRFRIGAGYDETRTKLLSRGSSDTVSFPSWTATSVGTIATHCSTALSTDTRPENNATDWWVVVQHPTGILGAEHVAAFALLGPEPNPSSGQAEVRFDLPVISLVRIALYDCKGALVRSPVSELVSPGHHSLTLGPALPAGIYLLRLAAGSYVQTRQLVILP
jgi:hypothetical protein